MTDSRSRESETIELHARDVEFDWSNTPLEWIAGEPFTSDFLTGLLHLVLPEGERWFCEVFTEALPYIKDEDLAREVRGFIGQEAIHAASHDGAATEYLERAGVDTAPFLRQAEYVFRRILGRRTSSTSEKAIYNDLVQRMWIIAAAEHYTAILGVFALNNRWHEYDVDPVMADICRWHGAEEVEHRSVAHDAAHYFDSSYLHRCRAMLTVLAFLLMALPRVGRYVSHARGARRRQSLVGFLFHYMRASHKGLLPPIREVLWATLQYFNPRFHPSSIGSTEQAVAYLATSQAVRLAG